MTEFLRSINHEPGTATAMDLTLTPTSYRDGSRKAAVSLLALLHQAFRARSPTSTVVSIPNTQTLL